MSLIVMVTGISGVGYFLDHDAKTVAQAKRAKRCRGLPSAEALFAEHCARWPRCISMHLTPTYVDPDALPGDDTRTPPPPSGEVGTASDARFIPSDTRPDEPTREDDTRIVG